MGYLINHDGYFVLKKTSDIDSLKFDYIKESELFDNSLKLITVDIFLLMMPSSNSVTYITPEYIKSGTYYYVNNKKIINRFLETMPASFNSLFSSFIKDIKISNRYKKYRNQIIEIIDKKFNEFFDSKIVDEDCYAMTILQINEIKELLH